MKHARSRSLIPLIAMAAFMAASVRADDAFLTGKQEYAGSNFAKAAEVYEELVASGNANAPVFYNLGNSYFQLHDFGRAILNYERSLTLEPNHPEAQTNLAVAREESHALELAPTWLDRFLHFARPNQYAVTAAAVFWIGAILLAVVAGSQRRRRFLTLIGFLCLGVSAALVFLLYSIENGPRGRGLAIVDKEQTEARLATADTAANVLTLPAGSEVKIEDKRGEWAYALLPNGSHGWIPLHQIDLVRF